MLALKSQRITIHPEGDINVWKRFHGNRLNNCCHLAQNHMVALKKVRGSVKSIQNWCNSCWDFSDWTTVVYRPSVCYNFKPENHSSFAKVWISFMLRRWSFTIYHQKLATQFAHFLVRWTWKMLLFPSMRLGFVVSQWLLKHVEVWVLRFGISIIMSTASIFCS